MNLTTRSALAGGAIGFAAGVVGFVVIYKWVRPELIDKAARYVREGVAAEVTDSIQDPTLRSLASSAAGPIGTLLAGSFRRALEEELPLP